MRTIEIGTLLLVLSTIGCGSADPPEIGRSVAEQTLQLGGSLRIAEKTGALTSLGQLPDGALTIQQIELKESPVTAEHLQKLAGLTNIEYLGLYGTDVTDAALDHVAVLKSLKELELSYTQVTDVGLAKLSGLTNLEKLYLHGTNDTVSDTSIQQLQKDLPQCRILR